MQREGPSLRFKPVLPVSWRGYKLHYRFGATRYLINLVQTDSVPGGLQVILDGKRLDDHRMPLVDNGQDHHVEVHCQPCGPEQPRVWPEDRITQKPESGDGAA
ncbi:hypothetical protein D3C84_811210 [compost metagenome]